MAVILATTPVLVAALGPDNFGVYVTIVAMTAYLAMSDLGIGAGLLTTLARASGAGDRREMSSLVVNAAWILAAAGATVCLFGLALSAADFVPTLLGIASEQSGDAVGALRVFVIGFSVSIPLALGARIQAALQQGAEAAVWLSLVSAMSAVSAAAVAWLTGSLVATMVAFVVVNGALSAAQLIRVVWQHQWLLEYGLRFRRGASAELLSSSGLLFILQVCAVVSFQSDIFIVSSVLGPEDAGVYHGVLRVFALVSLATTVLASQFWPATAEALTRGDTDWVRDKHRALSWQLPAVAGGASFVLVVFGQPLIGWWLGESLVPPLSLLIAFALWTTYTSFVLPYTQVLNAAGLLGLQVAFSVPMVVVNLALGLYWTPIYGVAAPVFASLIAHVVLALLPTVVMVRRRLNHGARASRHGDEDDRALALSIRRTKWGR